MSSIQLESVTQIVPEPQKLPQALVEKCAAISVRPDAIKSLTDAMQCKLFAVTQLQAILIQTKLELKWLTQAMQVVYFSNVVTLEEGRSKILIEYFQNNLLVRRTIQLRVVLSYYKPKYKCLESHKSLNKYFLPYPEVSYSTLCCYNINAVNFLFFVLLD